MYIKVYKCLCTRMYGLQGSFEIKDGRKGKNKRNRSGLNDGKKSFVTNCVRNFLSK